MGRWTGILAAFLLAGIVTIVVSSCEEDQMVGPDRNRAPETFITGAPAEGSQAGVSVHFFWRGWDSDGAVLAYEFAVDDTTFGSWQRTTKTDSVYLFRVPADDPDWEHTFYIAALDNDGKRDPTPASRRFTAVDRQPPLVTELWGSYERPGEAPLFFQGGDTIPAVPVGETPYEVRFFWTGADGDGWIVKYLWRVGDADPTEAAYAETTAVLAGSIAPKAAEDRTRYILYVLAEDNAGLQGGGGAAGVEAAELPFVVDFTPHTVIDTIRVLGTSWGTGWDPVAQDTFLTPPDTLVLPGSSLSPSMADTLTREAILQIKWISYDPEEGCVSGVRWQAQAGLFLSALYSEFDPGTCAGDTSRGTLVTPKVVAGPLSSPLKLWVRGRDGYERVEEPGAEVSLLVNFVPVPVIDSVRVGATDSLYVKVHATDRDDFSSEIRYAVSVDGGQRKEQQDRTVRFSPAEYDTSLDSHFIELRASNDFRTGKFYSVDSLWSRP